MSRRSIGGEIDRALRYGGLALALLAAVVVVWGLVDDRDGVVVVGLVSVALGVVLQRLDGVFAVAPSGFEGTFGALHRAIRAEVDDLQLPLDEVDRRELEEKLFRKTIVDLETRAVVIRAPVAVNRAAAPPANVEAAATSIAKDALAHALNVYCENGHPLDEAPDLPAYQRVPCPTCDSRSRRFDLKLGAPIPSGGFVPGGVTSRIPIAPTDDDRTEDEATRAEMRPTE